MKGIRRSLNKDRIGAPTGVVKTSGATPGGPPYGQRPTVAPAPAPPKRVIRATAAYRGRTAQELSFEVGDFFHVVSDEGGEDWFDAANPMTGARGLVPSSHFQVLGRNVRETNLQGPTQKSSTGSGSDRGSASGSSPYGAPAGGRSGSVSSASGLQPGAPYVGAAAHKASVSSQGSAQLRPPSQSTSKHQPLYGVVQYDFVAERPDELDAKRGEPIIVIAQSNHEWFVAKPIGRLGGPGLIPVAFVEIQDMATGKPVENVEELIRSAVVPKVEEWKKMTADYKQASIPLGRFDFAETSSAAAGSATASSSSAAAAAPAPTSAPPLQAIPSPNGGADHDQAYEQAYDSPTGDALSPRQGGYDPRYSYTRERRQYGLVTSASVESFHQEEGSFWFHLRAFFSTGASLVLYRLYQDFYDFQIALMDEFPVEAGRVAGDDGRTERILPMMPGPTTSEDENVCSQRVIDLSIYLSDLCALPEHIRASGLMYEFLVPRAGDVEVAAGHAGYGADASPAPSQGIENQYGELVDYLDQLDSSAGGRSSSEQHARGGYASGSAAGADVADQMGRMSLNGAGGPAYGNGSYQQQPQSQQQQQTEYDGASLVHSSSLPPPHPRADPAPSPCRADQYDQGYYDQPPRSAESTRPPMGTANQGAAFIKIKIFHRNTDDLIAIRVPPTVSLGALLDKVRDRLGSDVTQLRYREEGGGAAGSGAQLVGLRDDEELERWVRSGAKLVLVRRLSLPLVPLSFCALKRCDADVERAVRRLSGSCAGRARGSSGLSRFSSLFVFLPRLPGSGSFLSSQCTSASRASRRGVVRREHRLAPDKLARLHLVLPAGFPVRL